MIYIFGAKDGGLTGFPMGFLMGLPSEVITLKIKYHFPENIELYGVVIIPLDVH